MKNANTSKTELVILQGKEKQTLSKLPLPSSKITLPLPYSGRSVPRSPGLPGPPRSLASNLVARWAIKPLNLLRKPCWMSVGSSGSRGSAASTKTASPTSKSKMEQTWPVTHRAWGRIRKYLKYDFDVTAPKQLQNHSNQNSTSARTVHAPKQLMGLHGFTGSLLKTPFIIPAVTIRSPIDKISSVHKRSQDWACRIELKCAMDSWVQLPYITIYHQDLQGLESGQIALIHLPPSSAQKPSGKGTAVSAAPPSSRASRRKPNSHGHLSMRFCWEAAGLKTCLQNINPPKKNMPKTSRNIKRFWNRIFSRVFLARENGRTNGQIIGVYFRGAHSWHIAEPLPLQWKEQHPCQRLTTGCQNKGRRWTWVQLQIDYIDSSWF